eukprot:CAMPEP_0174833832 /NCGR_PEP_ID=MMETSP1114-20130205/4474_1 /TAXON_ID=312471 /ORGANISM="Neobodo designis, Strain CCAP 1951/1" /LENGTH=33 /DNA_ID= /DNA_START= /DNA_END= /DNA_ORIENTATION=
MTARNSSGYGTALWSKCTSTAQLTPPVPTAGWH